MMSLPLRRTSPRGILLLPLAVLLLYACTDQELPTSAVPSPEVGSVFEIRDGANGGNKHFFFLPPLVKQPTYSGTPDGTLSPEVLICDLGTSKPTASAQCAGWPAVAQFNRTSGTASEVIRYDEAGGHYVVNWHTDRCVWGACTLKTSNYYRIEIRVAGVLLGLADVDPVKSASDLRNYTTGDAIPLVNGRTLPLKFRIERGAISVLAPGQAAPITSSGGTVATEGGTVALTIPEGALSGSEPTPITVAPVLLSPATSGAIPGTVFDFGPDGTQFLTPITLSIRYDPAQLPAGVSESRLRLYLRTGLVWQLIPGSGVDPLTKTVTGQVHHFSEYAILPVAASLTVTPDSQTVAAGDTVRLDAAVQDSAGNRLNDRLVVWASSDMLVAVVDPTGLVTAVAPGSATITATSDGHSDAAVVTVEASASSSAGAITLSAGGGHTCFLTASGAAYCWGNNEYGQLGTTTAETCASPNYDPDFPEDYPPVPCSTRPIAVAGGLTFRALSTGWSRHTCGITTSGEAFCWGRGGNGELGNGSTGSSAEPVAVATSLRFKALTVGVGDFTCGIAQDDAAYCWGYGEFGQRGDGSRTYTVATPAPVAGGLRFASISSSKGHTCGITTSGDTYCWGINSAGQFGNGSTTSTTSPVPGATGLALATVRGGNENACGVTTGGAGYCWGSNYQGEVGDGSSNNTRPSPAAVTGGYSFTVLTGGGAHTCGITTGGSTYCWGSNQYGQLGTGSTTGSPNPVAVTGGLTFTEVSVGGDHTCGVSNGIVYCWGYNESGALGNGSRSNSAVPVRVADPQ